jgi:hypothetical protein
MSLRRCGASLVSRVTAAPAQRVATRGFAIQHAAAKPPTPAEKLGESFVAPPLSQFGLPGRWVPRPPQLNRPQSYDQAEPARPFGICRLRASIDERSVRMHC